MSLERLNSFLEVVLAANCQQYSALGQRLHILLKSPECLPTSRSCTDLDAFEPVVADNTAPQCVVKIKHEHFLGRHTKSGADVCHVTRYLDHEIERVGLLAFKPGPLFERCQSSVTIRKELNVANVQEIRCGHANRLIHQLAKRIVDACTAVA